MSVVFYIGRILFVAVFVSSGIQKLMNIPGTGQYIASKVPIPAMLAGVSAQLESALGMSTPQLLAIAAGLVEVIGGLLIVFNFGARWAALVLLLFTAAATMFFHDFWNMTGADRANNMVHALKNVSLIGGLLILFVLGSWRPAPSTRSY
jgi:uncharacterized membrane protein YphA (DoxX/SURF4 family)